MSNLFKIKKNEELLNANVEKLIYLTNLERTKERLTEALSLIGRAIEVTSLLVELSK